VATLVRILEVPNPEQAAALEVLMKRANSPTQEDGEGGRSGRGGGVDESDIEKAIIQALEPLQNRPNFHELVSMTNDYNQTLAHFAVLFGYLSLLERLVEWDIDLTIADVSGLTPLHYAYRGGDRAFVNLLLDAEAPENVLDALGRTPAHLMPDNFELLTDHDTEMVSDDQPELEYQFETLSLVESVNSGDGKSESEDTNSMTGAEPGPKTAIGGAEGPSQVPSTSRAAASGSKSRPQLQVKQRRIPNIPHTPDLNARLPYLEESLADPDAIDYLCKEVFPDSVISLEALRAPIPSQVVQIYFAGATEKYHGLLKKENDQYQCRLCPWGSELAFGDTEEALHHITKSHLDMGYGCKDSWYVTPIHVQVFSKY
jgi:hypothetical protein